MSNSESSSESNPAPGGGYQGYQGSGGSPSSAGQGSAGSGPDGSQGYQGSGGSNSGHQGYGGSGSSSQGGYRGYQGSGGSAEQTVAQIAMTFRPANKRDTRSFAGLATITNWRILLEHDRTGRRMLGDYVLVDELYYGEPIFRAVQAQMQADLNDYFQRYGQSGIFNLHSFNGGTYRDYYTRGVPAFAGIRVTRSKDSRKYQVSQVTAMLAEARIPVPLAGVDGQPFKGMAQITHSSVFSKGLFRANTGDVWQVTFIADPSDVDEAIGYLSEQTQAADQAFRS